LFNYYLDRPDLMSEDFRGRYPDQSRHRLVVDYVAGMTDRYAQNKYEKLMTS
jgi:dGTP triphosphohydrolase